MIPGYLTALPFSSALLNHAAFLPAISPYPFSVNDSSLSFHAFTQSTASSSEKSSISPLFAAARTTKLRNAEALLPLLSSAETSSVYFPASVSLKASVTFSFLTVSPCLRISLYVGSVSRLSVTVISGSAMSSPIKYQAFIPSARTVGRTSSTTFNVMVLEIVLPPTSTE